MTTISIISLLAIASVSGWSASPSKEDRPAIPADLYYEFKAVPADENAIVNWRRAAGVEVALSDKQKQIIKYCWTPGARQPDELDSLQSWFNRNKEALELFDASLQKTMAQWPERNPQNVQPELASLTLIVRARLFEADQMAERDKFSAASKSLKDTLKMAQTAVEGDAALINYLIACSARSLTQDAILRLACRKEVPVSLLEELLTNLPSLDSETNVYDHILRVEFTHDYNGSLDLGKLSDEWSKMSGTNATVISTLYPDDLQRAFRVLLDPSLIALHPKPFDSKAETEKSIRHYRIYRKNSLVPWTKRDSEVELDQEEGHANLVKDISELMELLKNESLPLSRQAAQKARATYLQIENPVGRIMATSIIGFMASDWKVCKVRTEREATRAFLALLIFERRKGQLPPTLSDLVREKILDSVPMDPFCGEPLHYSREGRRVWSVGDDGVDDHGTSGKLRWHEKDVVWTIPIAN